MKRISILIVVFILFAIPAWAIYQSSTFGNRSGIAAVGGGEPCNSAVYDLSNGDNESFEAGNGSFCTADLSETDTDAVINTSSIGFYHCGSNSLEIVSDSDNTNDNRVIAHTGSNETDFYYRFYVNLPALASGQYLRFNSVGNDDAELLGGNLFVQWFNNAGTYEFEIRSGATNPANELNLTPGQKYRVEIHAVSSGSSTMRVWDSAGNPVATDLGAPDYEQSVTSGAYYCDYIIFRDNNSTADGVTVYIDDLKVGLTAGDYLGAQTCQ